MTCFLDSFQRTQNVFSYKKAAELKLAGHICNTALYVTACPDW